MNQKYFTQLANPCFFPKMQLSKCASFQVFLFGYHLRYVIKIQINKPTTAMTKIQQKKKNTTTTKIPNDKPARLRLKFSPQKPTRLRL